MIDYETKRFLKRELKEYEKITLMTEEEREILHNWVEDGNSVHENGSFTCDEHGVPIDFLDSYREEMEILQALENMTYKEGTAYLIENYGINREYNPDSDLTDDELFF